MASMLETIATLATAGFSKSEIVELLKQSQPEPKPQQEPKTEPKPEHKQEPEAEPKTQDKSQIEKLFESLGMKIDTLTGAIQNQNIRSMGYGGPQEETTDEILARIINPVSGKEVE